MLLAGPYQIRELVYAPGHVQPPHRHDAAGMTLVLSGRIEERVGGREELATALSMVLKPAGIEHANRVGDAGARTLQVLGVGDLKGTDPIGRWKWIHGGKAARSLLAVVRLLRAPRTGPAAQTATRGADDDLADSTRSVDAEDRVSDALAALLTEARVPRSPPSWLARLREVLEDTSAMHVPLSALADEVGVHPFSASRAFRRHYGCSISEYRCRLRIQRVAMRLAAAPSISQAALAAGYADHPHLCRAFRGATGLTPREYRDIVRD